MLISKNCSNKIKYSILKNILFVLFIYSFSYNFAQEKVKWNPVESPIYSNLQNLIAFNNSASIALGNQIIIYKNNSWQVMQPQPPSVPSIIEANDFNSIWAASTSIYQESKLYYFDGIIWKQIFNPLANTISDMKFIEKDNGVICGLGEIAVYKKGKWTYLSPPTQSIIEQVIYTNDHEIYTLINHSGIYKYSPTKWKYVTGSSKVKKIKLKHGKIYAITNSNFGLIKNDSLQIISTNNFLKNVSSFDIGLNNSLTAVGKNGILINYKNGVWKSETINNKQNLNSIILNSNNSGWIVGDNGTILKLGINNLKHKAIDWKGFENLSFYLSAKSIDDEYGVVANDFNRDGKVDFFTCGLFEMNHLYINQGNHKFIDEAETRGVSGLSKDEVNDLNLGACAADIDNDGEDDLYVTVLNGKNILYKNIGKGYFVDYSSIAGGVGETNDRSNSCIFGDVDNDGDLDLFFVNENSTNRLYLNNGAGIFDEKTSEVGLKSENGGMGCAFGDIDNDGDIDLYIGNWSRKNKLFKNLLKENGKLKFEDISAISNVDGEAYTKSNAVVFADVDNDSYLDLFVTNRKTSNRLYLNNGKGIFIDKTLKMIGLDSMESYGAVIEDFDGDGYKDIYISNVGENIFYKNIRNNHFENQTLKYGEKIFGYSTGSATGDIDNDGDIDLYIANYVGEGSSILTNKLNSNSFIKIIINGIKNNRNGIGSKLYVYKRLDSNLPKKLMYYYEISGGSGYASMNELSKTVQLNNNKHVDVKVVFPNGFTKYFSDVKKGTTLQIEDTDGIEASIIIMKKWLINFFLDPHKLFEMIKWLFIILLVSYSSYRGTKRYHWSKSFVFFSAIILLTAYNLQYKFLEYENLLYSTVLPITSIALVVLLLHLFFGRERIKKMAVVERQNIREKLSRDLHDDLASTISSIGIYLTLIRYELTSEDGKMSQLLTKAESLIGDASSSITDLIWAFKPKPEFLSDLIIRINENFSGLFRERGIRFSISINDDIKKKLLSSEMKQNLYLIIKEALNNNLKYADSANISVDISGKGKKIIIKIIDDGQGFDIKRTKTKGHGLTNMRKRAEEINAEIKVLSDYNRGTHIELILNMT